MSLLLLTMPISAVLQKPDSFPSFPAAAGLPRLPKSHTHAAPLAARQMLFWRPTSLADDGFTKMRKQSPAKVDARQRTRPRWVISERTTGAGVSQIHNACKPQRHCIYIVST